MQYMLWLWLIGAMFHPPRGRLWVQFHEQGWDEPGWGSVPPRQGGCLQSGHWPHHERIQWPSVSWKHSLGHRPPGRRQHHHTGKKAACCCVTSLLRGKRICSGSQVPVWYQGSSMMDGSFLEHKILCLWEANSTGIFLGHSVIIQNWFQDLSYIWKLINCWGCAKKKKSIQDLGHGGKSINVCAMSDWMKCTLQFLFQIIDSPLRGWPKRSLGCVCCLDLIFISLDAAVTAGYQFLYLSSEKFDKKPLELITPIWTNREESGWISQRCVDDFFGSRIGYIF